MMSLVSFAQTKQGPPLLSMLPCLFRFVRWFLVFTGALFTDETQNNSAPSSSFSSTAAAPVAPLTSAL